MKPITILLILLSVVPLGCRNGEEHATTTHVEPAADVYTCPMHPTIVSDKPGSCPICGMALVKRTAAPATPTASAGAGAISLSPEQRVTANVKTIRVALDTHTGELVSTGRVTFDERRLAQVTAYTAGRIERLFVNFTGDSVRRGETVATIYSPELFATQQEYLLALENRERMRRAGFAGARSASDDLVESTRRRLNLFGMTAAQIAQLEKTRKPIFATNIVSSVSGVVTQKLAVEQQYVAQGQPLLEVADLSNVWVEVDVYEQQLASVQLGDRVEITIPAIPGRTFHGRVSFIVPVLAGATRTARVRIELANPGLQLKPDMYVNARILGAPAPPHIMVPASAVVDRGQKQFVWVETQPGTYEPRQVTTGGRHGEAIVIASGLHEGENVVVEGGFLLDSEAQLRGGHAHSTARENVMIRKLIELSANHRFIVLLLYAVVIGVGIWATFRTPLDAIPDISDNQVIVYVDWPGRSPQLVEDQVTYPLASNLQGLPNLKTVRAQSMFGFSLVYVIFDDDVDIYWARTRVLERLNYITGLLPAGVTPRLGPEGTGVGHVFWYTLQSKNHDLGQLRSIQDWYLKLGLQSVEGVAEVASVGGFVKQYQVNLDPIKMAARKVSLETVVDAVRRSNNDVGGRLIQVGQTEYIVRGIGYIKRVSDLENIVVDAPGGTPIYLSSIGTVQLSSDIRRGLLHEVDRENGTGEVVGGIIVARYGENAKAVIDRVKLRLAELERGLPQGVTIRTAYDRSELIERAVSTLKEALTEEAVIVSLVVIVFLLHGGSAITVLAGLPLSALISFILMKQFGITSNIMSLGGVALAIGEIVDASIVMVENAYRRLSEGDAGAPSRIRIIIESAQQVGPAIFGSLLVMIASFMPVFLLTGREGKMFKPLAYTKTFAMVGASVLAVTLVPVLMTFFMKGRMRPEHENPVSRFFTRIYEPFLRWSLRYGKTMLALNVIALVVAVPLMLSLGSEFMPPLDEGSLLYMPITLPAINITEARRIIQVQDAIIARHPAVKYVLGKVGRAETATDPAPVSMFETIIELKPKSEWPRGMTKDQIIQELDGQLKIAGVTNGWTQPIINRIDMLNTGVRTQLGVKIYGPDLETLEQLGLQAESILKKIDGAADLYTERISGGQYINIEADRDAIARYGIPVGVVLDAIETAIGGTNVTTTVEGRARYPVQVRYLPDYRDDVASLENMLITVPPGLQLPLGQLAKITASAGPAMINSENGQIRALVQLNVRGRDMGSFVDEAREAFDAQLKLPAGYSLQFSGQYENQIHARKRLQVVVPLVLIIIFVILYFTFHSITEAVLVMLSVPFALIGGVYLMWIYQFNWSVAVWVGFIALYGVAVQTGVVMVLYLHEALDRRLEAGRASARPVTAKELFDATVEGALLRVRPKIMTVATTVIGLLPLLWATGTGSDVMKPIAVPLIGGMVTSTIHVLLVTPIIFLIMKQRELRKGRLHPSGLKA